MSTTLLQRPNEVTKADRVDLRRRRDAAQADAIARRSDLLTPEDGALLRAVFEQGVSMRQLAAMRNESVRRVRNRVRTLATRSLSARFEFVMRRREDWPPTRRRVASACVLRGLTMREAAAELKVSLHSVRRHMDAINALCEQAGV